MCLNESEGPKTEEQKRKVERERVQSLRDLTGHFINGTRSTIEY